MGLNKITKEFCKTISINYNNSSISGFSKGLLLSDEVLSGCQQYLNALVELKSSVELLVEISDEINETMDVSLRWLELITSFEFSKTTNSTNEIVKVNNLHEENNKPSEIDNLHLLLIMPSILNLVTLCNDKEIQSSISKIFRSLNFNQLTNEMNKVWIDNRALRDKVKSLEFELLAVKSAATLPF